MDPERWRQIEQLFNAAVERNESERGAFLKEACGGDSAMQAEVESLLAHERQSEAFIDSPALEVAVKALNAENCQWTTPQQTDSGLIGKLVSHYHILERLGGGGMGVVYRAEDTRLGRPVALKFLPEGVAEDTQALERFKREARAASALNHPHILTVYDIGDDHGRPFIVMEFLEGETLKQCIERESLPVEPIIEFGMQISDALNAAHLKGIIHRDVKPANIFITARGQAKLLDFGLAKLASAAEPRTETLTERILETEGQPQLPGRDLTRTGALMGTAPYMSPEQVRGAPLDARTDLFSFGAVLYEMATRRRAFSGATMRETAEAILNQEPVAVRKLNRSVPPSFERIVHKALKKDREVRFQRAAEVHAELSRVRGQLYTVMRRRLTLAAVGLALLLAVVAWKWPSFPVRAPGPAIHSIAVLPFDNPSGDASQEYFADGITEALEKSLAQIRGIQIISHTSAMHYKGKDIALSEIAKELGVDTVVQGKAVRSNGTFRISAQMVHEPGDREIWARSYEGADSRLIAMQSDMANDITVKIGATTPVEFGNHLASAISAKPEAYDLYLRAEPYYGLQTREANDEAIRQLEKSVAIDPRFAGAYAALATAYRTRAYSIEVNEPAWVEKSSAAVEKAIALDPNLSEAYVSRGYLLWSRANGWAVERAVADYRHALELNPNLAEAHHQLANVYNHVGLFDKANEEIKMAIALDPLNTGIRFRVGVNLLYQGKYEEALIELNDSKKFLPTFWAFQTSFALQHLGRRGEARERIETFLKTNPSGFGGELSAMQALLAADAGDSPLAERKIREAIAEGKGYNHFHHIAYTVASAYALLGRHEQALKYLRLAADDGFPCYPLFEHDSNLGSLRNDPDFLNFLAEQKKQWEYFRDHV